MTEQTNPIPLVIYHGQCRDGFCAAWVARRALAEAEFYPAAHGQTPPDVAGREVYVLDFSYPRSTMDRMAEEANSLTVIDHHKTAEEALRGAPYATFDMNRSGAGMAWDFFFPGRSRPWMVDYVEDRDLWRYRLPDSRSVNAYLSVLAFDFTVWDVEARDGDIDTATRLGAVVESKTGQYVREVAKNAYRTEFEGHQALVVNAPQVDISELLEHLAMAAPISIGWWRRADGLISYGLRSRGDVDVSAIAKKYGGGGHAQAAGFQLGSLIL